MKVRDTWGHFGEQNMAPVRVKDSRMPLTSFDPGSCPKAQIITVPGSWEKGLHVVVSLTRLNT